MDEKEFRDRVERLAVDTRGPLPPYEDPTTLTRRDNFAMAALTGLLMMREFGTYESRVDDAFAIADLMEAARNKGGAE